MRHNPITLWTRVPRSMPLWLMHNIVRVGDSFVSSVWWRSCPGRAKARQKSRPAFRRWVQRLALFGPPPLLEGEDPATYDQLLARICEAVQPVDIIYEMLIANAVSLEWEVLRYRRLKWSLIRESVREALHHCRPCRRLSRSHQAERTHRRHGPARERHQGRQLRASGSDAAFDKRAKTAHLPQMRRPAV